MKRLTLIVLVAALSGCSGGIDHRALNALMIGVKMGYQCQREGLTESECTNHLVRIASEVE